MALFRIVADVENAAELWWTEADAAPASEYPSDGTVHDLVVERKDEVVVSGSELKEFLRWATQLPGWKDGPSYARRPFVVFDITKETVPIAGRLLIECMIEGARQGGSNDWRSYRIAPVDEEWIVGELGHKLDFATWRDAYAWADHYELGDDESALYNNDSFLYEDCGSFRSLTELGARVAAACGYRVDIDPYGCAYVIWP